MANNGRSASRTPSPAVKRMSSKVLISSTDFGLDLLRQTKDDESVVISPVSIALALALVHAGAFGKTKEQIRNALAKGCSDEELVEHYKQIGNVIMNSQDVKCLVGNRMYIKKGFTVKQPYLDTIKKDYAALAETIDFSQGEKCAEKVNGYVKEVTHDMIKEIVTPDSFNDTVALLLNAIYLDAKWKNQFSAADTREEDFHVVEGKTKKVKFLSAREVHRLYADTADAEILTLEYKDEAFSFSIILPKEKFGLSKLRASLTGDKLQEMLGSVKSTYMNVKFPKFKIEKELGLNDALKAVGVTEMFEEHKADLGGIAENLFVSEVKHKAVIEVDEEGTKAAAATAVAIMCRMLPEPAEVSFKADRPFLFFLVHKNRVVFAGQFH